MAALLIQSMCSSGGAALLECDIEVDKKYDKIWDTLLNQNILWLDGMVDVIVEV